MLLVDDEPARVDLRGALGREPDIEVVGEADADADVPALVCAGKPDVVMLDVRLRAADGASATHHLLRTVPDPPRVLVLTAFGNDRDVYDALQAGAAGFLLKRAGPAEVVHAVRTVAAGEAVLFPAAVRELVAVRGRCRQGGLGAAALTPREGEVLRWMARGLSDAEVARELAVGVEEAQAHVAAVIAKLGARGRVQAVIAAYESGFIDPRRPLD